MNTSTIIPLAFAVIVICTLPYCSCRIIPFGLNALTSGSTTMPLPIKGKDLKRDWCVGRSMPLKVHHEGCNSTEVKTKLCFGQCMTYYVQVSRSSYFLTCTLCAPSVIDKIEVKLKCANGRTQKKKVNIVRRCSCQTCRYVQEYIAAIHKNLYR